LSCKGERPDPRWEIVQVPPTGPGHVEFSRESIT
jgi:hypothetical protein